MMTFTPLGTGGAFSTDHLQSNVLLEVQGKRMLIDAGGTLHIALKKAGIPLSTIDAVYVSHTHKDHWGGAEFLAYNSYYDPEFVVDGIRRRLRIFSHPDVRKDLHHELYSTVLPDKKASIGDFFSVEQIGRSGFEWQGVQFSMTRAEHCQDDGQYIPCYGLRWTSLSIPPRTIWFSADTNLRAGSKNFKADVIFHDCETGPVKTGFHARYDELMGLPLRVRAKITLYHYNDGSKPDAVGDGFAGWAQQGASVAL